MNPDNADHLLLAAYLDGELSPGELLEMERRLETDPDLQQLLERLRALSGSVRRVVAATPVPAGLDARIAARLGASEALPQRRERRPWLPMAAALLIGLIGGGAVGYGFSHLQLAQSGGRTLDAIYAAHLRGLAAPQPFDIASSDRHVVKPWFNGRTAIAPDAPNFDAHGFPLVGGRVDIVDGEKVPTLVYRRRQHVISVTAVPRWRGVPAVTKREGTTIERWDAGDLSYFAISDLNGAELREFANLFQSRTAPSG